MSVCQNIDSLIYRHTEFTEFTDQLIYLALPIFCYNILVAKIRLLLFLITILVVGTAGLFVSYYARGYRFSTKDFKFLPNGILVIKSEPDGASVYINGELKTATNATISLTPDTYDIEVKKDGYFSWYKRLSIDKEIVTQAGVSLFRNVPSLSPATFSGAVNPIISIDGTKIAYVVKPGQNVTDDKIGLWTLDTFSLPLGFSNDPKKITDGDLTGSTYSFSPDDRQVLLTTSEGIFLLDTGTFTPQNQRINIASKKELTLAEWKKEKTAKELSLIKNLPSEVIDTLNRKTADFVFSPDQNLILYTASGSAKLADKLIPQLPGASTQQQERNIIAGRTYVYDIKEDRNFLVSDKPVVLNDQAQNPKSLLPALRWLSTSRHLLLSEPEKIIIMDHDGTNKNVVYAGSYIAPYAFPFNNTTRLLILTNLGGENLTPNLYTLTIK